MDKKIEKPWCIYGGIGWIGFGKVVSESSDKRAVHIIYFEKDETNTWWSNCVKRFDTLREAVEALHKSNPAEKPLQWYLDNANYSFPGELS